MKHLIRKILLATTSALLIVGVSMPVALAAQDRAEQQVSAQMVADGARYWATQCRRCHNLRDPKEFTDDIWDVSVNHMRIRANIPPNQVRAIKAFLKSSN